MKRNNYLLIGWILLLCLVAVTRFYALGQRGISHDESLHTFYAWKYADTGSYQHDPMMHGPFLFHMNAAVYKLFGDSDMTSRLAPALFGCLLVLAVFPFRRFLGDEGALITALLIALAPDIMFYSRYIRNEVYIALMMLLWVYAVFRYLTHPSFRWLLLATVSFAFSFTIKEVTFMHAAIMIAFLVPVYFSEQVRHRALWQSRAMDLTILFGTCMLPFACPFLHYALGWDPLDTQTISGQYHTYILAGILAVASLFVAAVWFIPGNKRLPGIPSLFAGWVACFILFWVINFTLYTSLFTNIPRGSASGLASGLGYWLSQHNVQRGSQPVFYYLMLLLLYNPLLLFGSIAALITLLWKTINKRLPEHPLPLFFFCWWSLSAFILYSLAGERMPWLLFHISLPMCFLTGWWISCILRSVCHTDTTPVRCFPFLLLIPTLIYLLLNLPNNSTAQDGYSCESVLTTMRMYRTVAAAVVLLILIISLFLNRGTFRKRMRFVLCGLILVLFGFCSVNAVRLCFSTYDLPTEHMVFAHGSNDLKPLARAIQTTWKQQYNPKAPVVAYDQESAWPLTWYLRSTPNRFFLTPDESILECPVIICGNKNKNAVQALTKDSYTESRQILIWWPLQDYMHTDGEQLKELLFDSQQRNKLLDIILYRKYTAPLSHWPLRHDAHVFIRKSSQSPQLQNKPEAPRHSPQLISKAFGPRRTVHPSMILNESYDGTPLNMPRSCTAAKDGSFYIADTGNNRIVILNPDGSLRRIVSPTPSLKEPWGIAVSEEGDFFVSDTWNGQIRRFNTNGKQVATWGSFAQAADPDKQPYALYGPRGLCFDNQSPSHLFVADTGNRRILVFEEDGSFIQTYEPFSEPINAAFIPKTDTMLVSEAWKARIALIDTVKNDVRHISVPFWRSRDANIKPFAAADEHHLYLSSPDNHCIVVFSFDGKPLYHFGQPGSSPDSMNQPTGLYFDPASDQLLVADSANNRILVFRTKDLTHAADKDLSND